MPSRFRRSTRTRLRRFRPKVRKVARRRTYRTRSSTAQTTIKSQSFPRTLMCKLPAYNRFTSTLAQANVSFLILGNSLVPMPQAGQNRDPAISFTSANVSWSTGDQAASGLDVYANIYQYSTVMGSSHRLQFLNASGINVLRVVAIPFAYSGQNGGILEIVNGFNALDFNSICTQQYAQSRLLNTNASGHEKTTMQFYRRAATMLGFSQARDNKDRLGLDLNSYQNPNMPPEAGWGIYIRLLGNPTSAFSLDVKSMCYTQLNNPVALRADTV